MIMQLLRLHDRLSTLVETRGEYRLRAIDLVLRDVGRIMGRYIHLQGYLKIRIVLVSLSFELLFLSQEHCIRENEGS
jgi:hypothetical protein